MLFPSRADILVLLKLAIPLILGGLVEGSLGFFSTFFLAHLGETALAAGALTSWLFMTLMVVLWGTLCAISILISHKYGAKDHHGVGVVLRDSFLLACILTLPCILLLWKAPYILHFLGQSDALVTLATPYIHALAFGVFPDFIMMVLLQFVIGLGHTRVSMVFTFIWVPINLLSNYLLVFGKYGFPQLGIAGLGWGTSLSYWITSLGFFTYLLLQTQYRQYFKIAFRKARPQYIKELIKTGLPIGAMFFMEVGFFFTITVLMGHLGSQVLGANQIAFQYLGQLSSISFAIANAITVRMGHMIGAANILAAKKAASAGMILAVTAMSIVAIIYWVFPLHLIAFDFDINDPANSTVIHLASTFLAFCAAFQLIESIRIALYGALRALKDTRYTFIVSVFSFWIISLPLGWILASPLKWQGAGYWCAMLVGALGGAYILFQRFKVKIDHTYITGSLD